MKTLNLMLNVALTGMIIVGTVMIVRMLGFQTHSHAIGYFFLVGLLGLLVGGVGLAYGWSKPTQLAASMSFVTGLLLAGAAFIFLVFLHAYHYEAIHVTVSEVNYVSTTYFLIGIPLAVFGWKIDRRRLKSANDNRRAQMYRRMESATG